MTLAIHELRVRAPSHQQIVEFLGRHTFPIVEGRSVTFV
jgi:hypothetical protein